MENLIIALAKQFAFDATTLKEGKTDAEFETAVIAEISDKFKLAKDEQHKRGQREAGVAVKKAIKAAGFNEFEENAPFGDIVTGFEAFVSGKNPVQADPAKMTADELLKLNAVNNLIKERMKGAKQELDTLRTDYDNFKKQMSVQEMRAKAQGIVTQHLKAKKAVLEGNGVSEETRLKAIFSMLDFSKVKEENGEFVAIDDNGNVVTDNFGKAKTLKELAEEVNPFGYHTADPNKKTHGNAPPQGGGGSKKQYGYTTVAEFDSAFKSQASPTERAAMMDWIVENSEKLK